LCQKVKKKYQKVAVHAAAAAAADLRSAGQHLEMDG
jgi:hypothetical protein